MDTRMCCGGQAPKPAGERDPTPEMALETEPIELTASDGEEVADLTCEPLEPAVIDLTRNDSVVITGARRRRRRNAEPGAGQAGDCVASCDEEGQVQDGDVCVVHGAPHNALGEEASSCPPPGCIWCRICMDGNSEIEQSRRCIYSTECGHICSQCLCSFLKYTKTCPVCWKIIHGHQYHRCSAAEGQTDSLPGVFHV